MLDSWGYPMYDWVWHIRTSYDPSKGHKFITPLHPNLVGFGSILTVWTPILKLVPSYRGVQSLSKTIAVPWPDHQGWTCPSWSHFWAPWRSKEQDSLPLGSSILFLELSPATWLTNPPPIIFDLSRCHFWGSLKTSWSAPLCAYEFPTSARGACWCQAKFCAQTSS